MGYPVVAKLLSRTITHKTDVGGVVLNLRTAEAVREAFETIRDAVTAKAGAEHFVGVTVQPMVSWSGYELIVGSSPTRSSGRCCCSGWAASWSRSSATGRWRSRR